MLDKFRAVAGIVAVSASAFSLSSRIEMNLGKYYDVTRARQEQLYDPTSAHLTNEQSQTHILDSRIEFNTEATDAGLILSSIIYINNSIDRHRLLVRNTSTFKMRLVLAPRLTGPLDSHEVLLKRIEQILKLEVGSFKPLAGIKEPTLCRVLKPN